MGANCSRGIILIDPKKKSMSLTEILSGQKFVEHLIAEQEVPPIKAIKYEYLLAGNGLFIRAKRKEFSVCLSLNRTSVKGLPDVNSEFIWHKERIPSRIWQEILANARADSDSSEFKEDVYVVYWQEKQATWCWKNIGKKRNYASTIADDELEEYKDACLEIHTHPPNATHFSQMDDRDEQGKFRIFGILIDVHNPNPKIRFRCGIYDYFVNISADDIGEMPSELFDLNLVEQVIRKQWK
jgi:PRTRC genetic system protein A